MFTLHVLYRYVNINGQIAHNSPFSMYYTDINVYNFIRSSISENLWTNCITSGVSESVKCCTMKYLYAVYKIACSAFFLRHALSLYCALATSLWSLTASLGFTNKICRTRILVGKQREVRFDITLYSALSL